MNSDVRDILEIGEQNQPKQIKKVKFFKKFSVKIIPNKIKKRKNQNAQPNLSKGPRVSIEKCGV